MCSAKLLLVCKYCHELFPKVNSARRHGSSAVLSYSFSFVNFQRIAILVKHFMQLMYLYRCYIVRL